MIVGKAFGRVILKAFPVCFDSFFVEISKFCLSGVICGKMYLKKVSSYGKMEGKARVLASFV
jgi:hypothetical protein